MSISVGMESPRRERKTVIPENGGIEAGIPLIGLADGNRIPQVGLGVLRIDDDETAPVIESALQVGYRHIDTAAGYGNEGGVGKGLEAGGFNSGELRSGLWLTTKLRDSEQGYDTALRAFDRQLGLLRSEYVDMYMIHWPTPFNWRAEETWKAFVRLRDEGRVKTLGVCNFLPADLERLHRETGEYPAIDQIELHPTWQQRDVTAYCRRHHIAVQAYSALARGADLDAGGGLLAEMARRHSTEVRQVSPAQIILRWHIENGTIVIPKSVHRERQMDNLALFDFALSADEHEAITALDGPQRSGHDPRTFSYS